MDVSSMLFPGFVTIFKDERGYIHLYFYPGIDNYNQLYYNALDLSDCKVNYTEQHNDDNSVEFVFNVKNIVKITCRLISKYNDIEYKTLTV